MAHDQTDWAHASRIVGREPMERFGSPLWGLYQRPVSNGIEPGKEQIPFMPDFAGGASRRWRIATTLAADPER